ncbi:MAG: hypothetical protein AABY92_08840, partial [Thermodesulfobacteriota bacterium]
CARNFGSSSRSRMRRDFIIIEYYHVVPLLRDGFPDVLVDDVPAALKRELPFNAAQVIIRS